MAMEPAINWEEKYLGQIDEGMSDLRSRFGKMEDRLQSMATKEDVHRLEMTSKDDFKEIRGDIKTLEGKVDRFYWFLVGILGTAIGSLVVAIISLVKHP